MGNKRRVTAYLSRLVELQIPNQLIERCTCPLASIWRAAGCGNRPVSRGEIQAVKYGHSGGFVSIKQASSEFEKRDELF